MLTRTILQSVKHASFTTVIALLCVVVFCVWKISTWSNITLDVQIGSMQRKQITTQPMVKPIQRRNSSPQSFSIPTDEACIKRLPQAIIIGVPRCGTTTLATFLNDHPQIAINYWDSYYFDRNSNRSLEWYINQMPCSYSNQITMERTASYFHAQGAPERIFNWNPHVKLIVTFKEPVERVISDYAGLQDEGTLNKNISLEDYATTNDRTKIKAGAWAVGLSNYQSYMKTWLKYFKLKQILIINGTNFILNPSHEMAKVENFLGVGNYFTRDRFMYNETKRKYCIIRNGSPACMDKRRGRPHPPLDPKVRLLLQNYYKPLNEQFFNMIQKRFDWGY